MALNTSTSSYTQTERSKIRAELQEYMRDNPNVQFPGFLTSGYQDDLDEYLDASPSERREDWTGRPSRVDYVADAIIGSANNPETQQFISTLPDIGVDVGDTVTQKNYHGPTSLLGKIGQGIAMAGMAAAAGLAGAGLLNAAGLVGAVPGVGTSGSGLLGAEAGRNALSPLTLELMGNTGIGSTSAITGAGAGAGNMGMAAFDAATGITTPASNLNAYGALTEAAGGLTLPTGANLGMAGYNNVMNTLGPGVVSPNGVGVLSPESLAEIGTPLGLPPGEGIGAGIAETIGTATGSGVYPGLTTGAKLATGAGLLNTLSEFVDDLDADDILTAGSVIGGLLDDNNNTNQTITAGDGTNFTPFDPVSVQAPDTPMVFPRGGYYQQQANAMVPGGGQQMPTPEEYQGLLNSAFSRRV